MSAGRSILSEVSIRPLVSLSPSPNVRSTGERQSGIVNGSTSLEAIRSCWRCAYADLRGGSTRGCLGEWHCGIPEAFVNRPVTTPQIETGYLNGGGRGGNPKPGVVGMMREDEGAVGMMGGAVGMMGED